MPGDGALLTFGFSEECSISSCLCTDPIYNSTIAQVQVALKAVYQRDIPPYQLGAILSTHTGPGKAAVAVVTAKQ